MVDMQKSVVESEQGLGCRPANSAYPFWARHAERWVAKSSIYLNMKTLIQNRKILIMSLLLLYTFSIFVGCSSNNDNDEKYIAELEAKIVELEGMLEKAKELQEREPIDLEPIHDSFSQQVQQLKTELAECQQLLTEGAIIQ